MTFALATGWGRGVAALSLQLVIVGCSRVGFGFGAIQIFDITYIIKIAEVSIIIIDDDDDEKGETGFFVLITHHPAGKKALVLAPNSTTTCVSGSSNKISRPFFFRAHLSVRRSEDKHTFVWCVTTCLSGTTWESVNERPLLEKDCMKVELNSEICSSYVCMSIIFCS